MEKTTLHGEQNGFNLQDAINKLLAENDTATLEQIPAVFVDEAWGDDESYESKGRAMLEAYLKGDVDGFCIAREELESLGYGDFIRNYFDDAEG